MAYVTPATVAAGDVATAAAWNVLTNDVIAMRASAINVVSTLITAPLTISVGTTGNSAVVTGLTVNITPTSSSSKILILASMNLYEPRSGTFPFLRRNSSAIMVGDANGSRQRVTTQASGGGVEPISMLFLDSPATTSSVTYDVAVMSGGAPSRTYYVNRDDTYTNATNYFTTASSITVMEIPV